jgi:hypothetical protein
VQVPVDEGIQREISVVVTVGIYHSLGGLEPSPEEDQLREKANQKTRNLLTNLYNISTRLT